MKKLFLIDAYSLIFRAYYAFIRRPIINSKGFETSAIFGFTKSLLEVLKKEQPTHIAVAFDLPHKTFRHEMYPEYKGQREQTPESIIQSSPIIKDIIRAMNIPVLEVPGYEADDVIGTLAKKAEKEGFEVYMVTPDKDYGQLVSDKVFMYKPKRQNEGVEILGAPEICELYGGIENPMQVVDILALWGDAADNVPGIPGVGEKGAIKLIKEYGSVENIYNHLDELKGKLQISLKENKDKADLAKKLITIEIEVPIEWDEDALRLEDPDKEKLKDIFIDLEFSSILRELKLLETITVPTTTALASNTQQTSLFNFEETSTTTVIQNYKTVRDIEHQYHLAESTDEQDKLIELLGTQSEFCFDTETSGLNTIDSRIIGMSFAIKKYEAWYVPVPVDFDAALKVIERFKTVFENPNIAKIGQNLKFDILMLKNFGVHVQGSLLDTMLMHYLIEPEARHNMTYLSETYLGYSPIEIDALIGKKGVKQLSMANVNIQAIAEYAAEDADVTIQLKEKLHELLIANDLLKLYTDIEAPLVYVLADMEYAGVKIDSDSLNELNKTFTEELIKLEDEIRAFAEEPTLNVSSPKQLGIILFEKMKIDANVKRTKTKQYSTSEETLVGLTNKHPIINKILEFRSLKKLLSSYIESLPALVNKTTGRIHTSFNQAVTATGRLSSNNPNLQNIPIRDAKGREIRKAFIPSDENHTLLAVDYSQIELRLMAHMSGDESFIEAFKQNEDIHTATAAKVFHVNITEVTKDQRSKAKTANFGIIYGISAFGLSQRLNIPRSEAKDLIDNYFISYPGVKSYMDKTITNAQHNQYVSTLFGRKRWLRDINSANSLVRGNAERNAINAPIQGSAADIIKVAMIRINNALKNKGYASRMILQVHDELVFDVVNAELDAVENIVVYEMENAIQLNVPLIAESGTGKNWIEAH